MTNEANIKNKELETMTLDAKIELVHEITEKVKAARLRMNKTNIPDEADVNISQFWNALMTNIAEERGLI